MGGKEEIIKADKGAQRSYKPDYSLIPKSFMDQMAAVMLAGLYKYLRNNYRKGHSSNELTAAVVRHAKEIESGADIDQDTTQRLIDGCYDLNGDWHSGFGESAPKVLHWACIAASALMAIEQIRLGTHRDDRWREGDPDEKRN